MYETFTLRELKDGIIRGYHWKMADPDKVICIVHGIGEYGGRYDRVAEKFKEANMATISMDLRGHGDSIEKKGHCAPRKEVLSDIDELIFYARKYYPGKPVILYGHSMGGNIALDYRSRGEFNDIPTAYLISAPWVRLVKPVTGILYKTVKLLSNIAPSFTISSAVDEKVLGHPDSVLPYNENPMVHNRISALCAINGFEVGTALENGTHETNGKGANIPTLIMHGTEDKICDIAGTELVYDNLKARGENVEFIRWPGLYHEIHNGSKDSRGDEVIDKMIEFFKSVTD